MLIAVNDTIMHASVYIPRQMNNLISGNQAYLIAMFFPQVCNRKINFKLPFTLTWAYIMIAIISWYHNK